jgi:CRISPR-associated RAMP protein (TIGR02581 family)
MMWDIFENRLVLTAELIAKTGLRVGAGGQSAEPAASDLPVIKTADNKPFIPGSSLRGVLRSHIERIVRAFEDVGAGKSACSPPVEAEWCVTSQRREQIRSSANSDDAYARAIFHECCRVCRVFGSPWMASRVRISDLPCLNGVEVETRDAVAIDREKETVANKYDFEAMPVGSRFGLEIMADNLGETERGLLWLGIEELMRDQILVGGFKGRGLGRMTLENPELCFVDRSGLRDYLLTGKLPSRNLSEAQDWLKKLLRELTGRDD